MSISTVLCLARGCYRGSGEVGLEKPAFVPVPGHRRLELLPQDIADAVGGVAGSLVDQVVGMEEVVEMPHGHDGCRGMESFEREETELLSESRLEVALPETAEQRSGLVLHMVDRVGQDPSQFVGHDGMKSPLPAEPSHVVVEQRMEFPAGIFTGGKQLVASPNLSGSPRNVGNVFSLGLTSGFRVLDSELEGLLIERFNGLVRRPRADTRLDRAEESPLDQFVHRPGQQTRPAGQSHCGIHQPLGCLYSAGKPDH